MQHTFFLTGAHLQPREHLRLVSTRIWKCSSILFSISITASRSAFNISPWNAVPPPLYSKGSSFQVLSWADVDVIERAPVPCWVSKTVLTISERLNLVDVAVEIATLTVSD